MVGLRRTNTYVVHEERFGTYGMANDELDQYMPNEYDELEVLAECEKHYVLQPRSEMKAGILAPCTRCLKVPANKEMLCDTCGVNKVRKYSTCARCKKRADRERKRNA